MSVYRVYAFLAALVFAGTAHAQATGMVSRSYAPMPPTNSNATRPVNLEYKVSSLETPTFASDLNNALMTEELMQQMDGRYHAQLEEFSNQNGLTIMDRDSNRATRGLQMSPDQELQVRRDMAKSMQTYMLLRGLPKFLSTRESTKGLAKNYTAVIQQAQNATQVSMKSESSNWHVGTGVNPFTSRAWANVSDDAWKFEAAHQLTTKSSTLSGGKKWKRYTYESLLARVDPALVANSWGLTQSLACTFNPALSGSVSVMKPFRADWTQTTVSMGYTF